MSLLELTSGLSQRRGLASLLDRDYGKLRMDGEVRSAGLVTFRRGCEKLQPNDGRTFPKGWISFASGGASKVLGFLL